MEACPDGRTEAEVCQMQLKSIVSPLVHKPLLLWNDRINLCCGVAQGVDCLVRNAFPKCNQIERLSLEEAAYTLLRQFPLVRMSCAPFEFIDGEPPDSCSNFLNGSEPKQHMSPLIIAFIVCVVLAALVPLLIWLYKRRT